MSFFLICNNSDTLKNPACASKHAQIGLATPTVKKEPTTPELLSLMYNSNNKENDLFSQSTICACLLAYSVLLFGMNMQIYVASKIMSFLLICNNSDTLKNPAYASKHAQIVR
jgi:hypothetical protein